MPTCHHGVSRRQLYLNLTLFKPPLSLSEISNCPTLVPSAVTYLLCTCTSSSHSSVFASDRTRRPGSTCYFNWISYSIGMHVQCCTCHISADLCNGNTVRVVCGCPVQPAAGLFQLFPNKCRQSTAPGPRLLPASSFHVVKAKLCTY